MIDPNKCEFEESFDLEDGSTVFYFTYPKDMSETCFDNEEEYGNVIGMCISVTVDETDGYYVQMSPTIEYEEDGVVYRSDVDWRDLYYAVNYDYVTIVKMLMKAPR